MVTPGSLERKKEWLEHLKKRIFKMTLRDQNEFEAETTMSKQSGTLFNIKLTFTDDDDVGEDDDDNDDDDGNGDDGGGGDGGGGGGGL